MTIPVKSNFPEEIDTDDNMFLVHDSLRVRLLRDYLPGDTKIFVYGDSAAISRFPPTGIITLTEQCSDAELRALSFYYSSKTDISFDGLELLPGFTDNPKPKDITNVTQNVMASHHNNIKEAVLAIQKFAGRKGEVGVKPLEGTMEERTNYLRKIVLVPKAWFAADKTIGLVPLTVEFRDLSFRLGTDGNTGVISYIWDFGDNTGPSVVLISATNGPINQSDVIVQDLDGGTIQKIYTTPNNYDVKLTVRNDFGEDTVIFPQYINARVEAPQEAVINYVPRSGQLLEAGLPTGGPYTTPPKIRTPTTLLLDLEIPYGINPNTGRTFSGEEVDGGGSPIDPIVAYTWSLADDLVHGNSNTARASYSIGGVYDLILRVDTKYGSYRITTYENSIDVVEKYNLWLWLYNGTNQVKATEFGLISESFKIRSTNLMTLNANQSFLEGEPNEEQQIREFKRNVGFAPRGVAGSGTSGVGLLYWASGRNPADSYLTEKILFSEFNGFSDTYTTQSPIARPWNWIGLVDTENIYFILGGEGPTPAPNTSPTNQQKQTVDLASLGVSSNTFTNGNYKNGAGELKQNEVTYDGGGVSLQGNMSVYRSTWKDSEGFFLRNQGVGDFFRIKTFYKTSGNTSDPFIDIRKLQDMAGPVKEEGQLVTLSKGVYFFNNSGSISAYNPTSSVWETGGPGINSAAFRLLQDNTQVGFDNLSQTLLAASDGDKVVYLSFDYSEKSFIKFNETDLTFSSITSRPVGDQWNMTIF
jgi:PKD repeat protein